MNWICSIGLCISFSIICNFLCKVAVYININSIPTARRLNLNNNMTPFIRLKSGRAENIGRVNIVIPGILGISAIMQIAVFKEIKIFSCSPRWCFLTDIENYAVGYILTRIIPSWNCVTLWGCCFCAVKLVVCCNTAGNIQHIALNVSWVCYSGIILIIRYTVNCCILHRVVIISCAVFSIGWRSSVVKLFDRLAHIVERKCSVIYTEVWNVAVESIIGCPRWNTEKKIAALLNIFKEWGIKRIIVTRSTLLWNRFAVFSKFILKQITVNTHCHIVFGDCKCV